MATKKTKKESAVVKMLRTQKKGTEYYLFPVKTFGTIIGTMADGVTAPPPKVRVIILPNPTPPTDSGDGVAAAIIPVPAPSN